MMQNYPAANPLPRRLHEFLTAKKVDYGSNARHAEHLARKVQEFFTNDGCMDKIINVNEENPCEVAKEYFANYAEEVFELVLSRPPFDEFEAFLEFLKPKCMKCLIEAMEVLGFCFHGGTKDALEWIKSNIQNYYRARTSHPNPAFVEGIVKGKSLATFNMFSQLYAKALELYPQGEPQEDQEMNDEEEKKEQESAPAQTASNPLERFKLIMAKDKEYMEKASYDQGAPSRAYSSTCSFTKDKTLPMSEAVLKTNDYMKDRSKKLAEINAEHTVRDKVRRNMIINGGFPQAKVEEKLGSIKEMPKELVAAYIKMQKAAIKFRLSQDDDYKSM